MEYILYITEYQLIANHCQYAYKKKNNTNIEDEYIFHFYIRYIEFLNKNHNICIYNIYKSYTYKYNHYFECIVITYNKDISVSTS